MQGRKPKFLNYSNIVLINSSLILDIFFVSFVLLLPFYSFTFFTFLQIWTGWHVIVIGILIAGVTPELLLSPELCPSRRTVFSMLFF